MSDASLPPSSPESKSAPEGGDARTEHTIGSSTLHRLCMEMIALREFNNREHQRFEKALSRAREDMQGNFNKFAGETQKAYQQLRQELNGEKRISLSLLNELLEIDTDLRHIVASRPASADLEALTLWGNAVEVQARKVHAALERHGIRSYDAQVGSAYNPAIHERVGTKRAEGMDALRVAEQVEPGYASQQPDFVLRRPKVIVSE